MTSAACGVGPSNSPDIALSSSSTPTSIDCRSCEADNPPPTCRVRDGHGKSMRINCSTAGCGREDCSTRVSPPVHFVFAGAATTATVQATALPSADAQRFITRALVAQALRCQLTSSGDGFLLVNKSQLRGGRRLGAVWHCSWRPSFLWPSALSARPQATRQAAARPWHFLLFSAACQPCRSEPARSGPPCSTSSALSTPCHRGAGPLCDAHATCPGKAEWVRRHSCPR